MVLLLLGALVNGATFCAFTYLAPLVTEVTGLGTGWVPAVLALFGLGSFVGVSGAGRTADAHLRLGARRTGPAHRLDRDGAHRREPRGRARAPLRPGALSFAVGSTLVSQALYAATGAPTLGGGFATAALNVGAALGPWCGGAALTAGLGYRSPLWVSALLTALALVVGGLARVTRRGPATAPRRAARPSRTDDSAAPATTGEPADGRRVR